MEIDLSMDVYISLSLSQCLYLSVCVWVCVCVCLYVCVCVCVTYVLSNFYLLHFISNPKFLHLPVPVYIPAIRRLRYLRCYLPISINPLSSVFGVSPSRPSCYLSQDSATPGHKQCHHCSICQLWFLLNACPFVVRAAEDQAVRPHYC